MSRSGYSDDCENLDLYRGQVESAIRGKRGQAFLRDLVRALDAMPVKRLIRDALESDDGEVCGIGALGRARGIDLGKLDPEDGGAVGKAFGIARQLACETVYWNDEVLSRITPEERWERLRAWAVEHIVVRPEELQGLGSAEEGSA